MFAIFQRKTTIAESGILEGFTDRHSHILPGVDDGFQTLPDSLEALQAIEQLGVTEQWLTPHIMEDFPNTPEDLHTRFEKLKESYTGRLRLHLAAEHMLDNLFVERFAERRLMEMEDRMVLVETSYAMPPIDFSGMLSDLKVRGYRPLLAHPERYRYMESENDYRRLKERGILFQLNLPSLAGAYGKSAQGKARLLLKRGWYDFVGSDVHTLVSYINVVTRIPIPKSEIDLLRQIISSK